MSSCIDPGLAWDDFPWFQPINLLKGIQCGEDTVRALTLGLHGCVLSNHDGRQLDTCQPGIAVTDAAAFRFSSWLHMFNS